MCFEMFQFPKRLTQSKEHDDSSNNDVHRTIEAAISSTHRHAKTSEHEKLYEEIGTSNLNGKNGEGPRQNELTDAIPNELVDLPLIVFDPNLENDSMIGANKNGECSQTHRASSLPGELVFQILLENRLNFCKAHSIILF